MLLFMCLIFQWTFICGRTASIYSDPHCVGGHDTIVHLFEWKWTDIKNECETFLGPKGFCAVQVSPACENAVVTNPNRPWYERYQPVNYNSLQTRSGNGQEFREMVAACNTAGVRIYVDVVINHMTGAFAGNGTGGTPFDGNKQQYPGVPFGPGDFNSGDNCHTWDGSIHDYNNPEEVRNCNLLSLQDLRLGKDYVRFKVSEYLNYLIDVGVAGFRVDASKHMWPGDLEDILSRLKNLITDVFGQDKRPFLYHEVIDLGNGAIRMSEYFHAGRVTNFIYGAKLAAIFLQHSDEARWLESWGEKWGMPNTDHSVVFLSNHDNQRGHGGGGSTITFRRPRELKIATAFMLAHPYGFPRIMSSYDWPVNYENGVDTNDWMGPPHNEDFSIKDVVINGDNTCADKWVCEHRWRQIYNMVKFCNVVSGTELVNWHSILDWQIAFSRGNRGFIVIVADNTILNTTLKTNLPFGTYCDVISGDYEHGGCSGVKVFVNSNGEANITIDGSSSDPVIAIHIDARLPEPAKP